MRLSDDDEAIRYFRLAVKKEMNVNAMINISILLCKDS